jgi:hypothetical protein
MESVEKKVKCAREFTELQASREADQGGAV